jgi:hypothetical protein
MSARDYMLEHPEYPTVPPSGDNPIGAGNQQGRPVSTGTLRGHTSRNLLAAARVDDMVRATQRCVEAGGTRNDLPALQTTVRRNKHSMIDGLNKIPVARDWGLLAA